MGFTGFCYETDILNYQNLSILLAKITISVFEKAKQNRLF